MRGLDGAWTVFEPLAEYHGPHGWLWEDWAGRQRGAMLGAAAISEDGGARRASDRKRVIIGSCGREHAVTVWRQPVLLATAVEVIQDKRPHGAAEVVREHCVQEVGTTELAPSRYDRSSVRAGARGVGPIAAGWNSERGGVSRGC